MKRPEYVAVITRIYARLLEEEGRGPTADERAELEQAFSRSGFTDWYWQGKHGAAMFGTRPENAPDPKDLFEEARRAYEQDSLRTVPVDLSCSSFRGGALHPDCVGPGRPQRHGHRPGAGGRPDPGPGWTGAGSPPPQDRRHRLPLRHRGHPGR